MTGLLWLSRLSLKRTPEIAALVRTLLPEDDAEAAAAHHRLVWSAFADKPERARDFLWRREEGAGRFLALSARPPHEQSALFEVETKTFDPLLAPGDRLGFELRFNPTVDRKEAGRSDVVMDRLKPLPKEQRAARRDRCAETAAREWLETRAERDGFRVEAFSVQSYRTERVRRGSGRRDGTIGVVDARGALTVDDPQRFLVRLAMGFGRAKAFGCGLMLIRRMGHHAARGQRCSPCPRG